MQVLLAGKCAVQMLSCVSHVVSSGYFAQCFFEARVERPLPGLVLMSAGVASAPPAPAERRKGARLYSPLILQLPHGPRVLSRSVSGSPDLSVHCHFPHPCHQGAKCWSAQQPGQFHVLVERPNGAFRGRLWSWTEFEGRCHSAAVPLGARPSHLQSGNNNSAWLLKMKWVDVC